MPYTFKQIAGMSADQISDLASGNKTYREFCAAVKRAAKAAALDAPQTGAFDHLVEFMETLNEWFAQRADGKPTTNSEAVIWRELNGRLQMVAPSQPGCADAILSVLDAPSTQHVEADVLGGAEFTFRLRPMDAAPTGDDALEPQELEIHEGSWAIVLGTNAKAIGWIDMHALFDGRTYRDRLYAPTQPSVDESGKGSE